MGGWNWLDWTLAVITVLSIVTAMRKGFVQEIIGLASLVVGVIVAALFYPRAAGWFADLTRSPQVASAAGFLTLFVATLVVGALVSVVARKLIKSAGVEWFDRFLGGLFGLVRGVVVASVLLMVLVAFAVKPNAVQQSELAPYVTAGARVLALAMPGDLKAQFRSGFEKFREGMVSKDRKDSGK